MTDHAANVRRQIGELAELSAKTAHAERRILERAEYLLDGIQKQISEVKPLALLSAKDGETYQDLILDRHRLEVVIAQAQRNLRVE